MNDTIVNTGAARNVFISIFWKTVEWRLRNKMLLEKIYDNNNIKWYRIGNWVKQIMLVIRKWNKFASST